MEQHERALELETRRLSGINLAGKPVNNQPFFGYSMDELKVSEGSLLTYCLIFFPLVAACYRFNFNFFM